MASPKNSHDAWLKVVTRTHPAMPSPAPLTIYVPFPYNRRSMTPDSAIPSDGNPADDEISPVPATISEDSTENVPSQGAPADDGVLLYERTFEIHHDLQKRVDLYLRDRLPAYSRAMLQKIIKADSVFVNGHVAKSSTLLRSGDVVRVTPCTPLRKRPFRKTSRWRSSMRMTCLPSPSTSSVT